MLYKKIALHIIFVSLIFSAQANTSNYWIKQGDIALSKQNIEESIILYSRAIQESPKHALGYIKRAKAYRASNQLVKSAEDMRRAVEIDPQFTKSFLKTRKNRPESYNQK
ncbi:MAG: hypothetical protein ABJG47_12665 [Ekhidna sp.]